MDEATDRLIEIVRRVKSTYSEENIVLAIPGFLSKSFTSFCSMREDLILIKQYLKRMMVENDEVVKSALTYSSISLYGKCFTDAASSNAPKLEPNQLFVEGNEFHGTHEYLMNLRHHFISHRGVTDSEIEVSYLLVPWEGEQTQVRYSRLKKIAFDTEQRRSIDKLINYLLEKLAAKIQKSGQKVYKAYLKNFTPEQITQMMLNNMQDDENDTVPNTMQPPAG